MHWQAFQTDWLHTLIIDGYCILKCCFFSIWIHFRQRLVLTKLHSIDQPHLAADSLSFFKLKFNYFRVLRTYVFGQVLRSAWNLNSVYTLGRSLLCFRFLTQPFAQTTIRQIIVTFRMKGHFTVFFEFFCLLSSVALSL